MSETGVDLQSTPAVVGSNLRAFRLARDLSQQELADKSGISRQVVSEIESARSNPQLSTLQSVADGLGVNINELLSVQRYNMRRAADEVPED